MISIFDPKTGTRRDLALPNSLDLPLDSLLLVNILIELQVISEQLTESQRGGDLDEPDMVRADLTSLS
jgi:hypothetical protein